jgi:hypothetical protein
MSDIQYITDAKGKRTAGILPINEYEDLLAERYESPDEEAELERRFVLALEEAEGGPAVAESEVMELLRSDP